MQIPELVVLKDNRQVIWPYPDAAFAEAGFRKRRENIAELEKLTTIYLFDQGKYIRVAIQLFQPPVFIRRENSIGFAVWF
jgi:hypothetical protein